MVDCALKDSVMVDGESTLIAPWVQMIMMVSRLKMTLLMVMQRVWEKLLHVGSL